MNKYSNEQLIKYLIDSGVILTPVNKKIPVLAGWQELDYFNLDKKDDNYLLSILKSRDEEVRKRQLNNLKRFRASGSDYYSRLINWLNRDNNHGIGMVLHNDMLVVDFDPGHDSESNYIKHKKALSSLIMGNRTLYAFKHNSHNLHIFYKNDKNIDIKGIGEVKNIDVFSKGQQITCINPYIFANLDFSKSFYDNLSSTPDKILELVNNNPRNVHNCVRNTSDMKQSNKKIKVKKQKANGKEWLIHLLNVKTLQGWFQDGQVNNDIYKFSYIAMINGVSYDDTVYIMSNFYDNVLVKFGLDQNNIFATIDSAYSNMEE